MSFSEKITFILINEATGHMFVINVTSKIGEYWILGVMWNLGIWHWTSKQCLSSLPHQLQRNGYFQVVSLIFNHHFFKCFLSLQSIIHNNFLAPKYRCSKWNWIWSLYWLWRKLYNGFYNKKKKEIETNNSWSC